MNLMNFKSTHFYLRKDFYFRLFNVIIKCGPVSESVCRQNVRRIKCTCLVGKYGLEDTLIINSTIWKKSRFLLRGRGQFGTVMNYLSVGTQIANIHNLNTYFIQERLHLMKKLHFEQEEVLMKNVYNCKTST